MKTKCSALLALVTGGLLLGSIQVSVAQSVPPVKIILDTDMAWIVTIWERLRNYTPLRTKGK